MITILPGDCREVLAGLEANGFAACVTDPPYGLEFMAKDWDAPWQLGGKSPLFGDRKTATPGGWGGTRNANCRRCGGRARGAKTCQCEVPDWDEAPEATRLRQMRGFQDWCEDWARAVYRVLKPGAHLVAFGGTRTYHRLACAIEDAGFEIRDQLAWVYGSGFPKSLDVSKAIDRAVGVDGELGDVVGKSSAKRTAMAGDFAGGEYRQYFPATDAARQWAGWGTSLKPAHEPIVLARKPLSEGTVAANVLRWGTGALNIDASRVNIADEEHERLAEWHTKYGQRDYANGEIYGDYEHGRISAPHARGRWPANLAHDGSPEVLEAFARFGERPTSQQQTEGVRRGRGNGWGNCSDGPHHGDTGTAARFFYTAKAAKFEREGSHPTVKPVALMEWLVGLVTPTGGAVLDPFCGTGSTLVACDWLGIDATGIELDPQTCADAERKVKRLLARRMRGDDAAPSASLPGQMAFEL